MVVNEVQTAGGGGGTGASDEFVELYNQCATSQSLSGWQLAYRSAGNNSGGADTVLFNFTSQTIGATGYLLLAGSGYTGTATADATMTNGLAVSGAVGIKNGTTLIDSVSYGTLTATNAFTETAAAAGPPASQSIARSPNGADSNNNGTDFVVRATPTPKAANP